MILKNIRTKEHLSYVSCILCGYQVSGHKSQPSGHHIEKKFCHHNAGWQVRKQLVHVPTGSIMMESLVCFLEITVKNHTLCNETWGNKLQIVWFLLHLSIMCDLQGFHFSPFINFMSEKSPCFGPQFEIGRKTSVTV